VCSKQRLHTEKFYKGEPRPATLYVADWGLFCLCPSEFYFNGLVESRKGRFVIVQQAVGQLYLSYFQHLICYYQIFPQVVGKFDNTIDLSRFIL
jgi:hypothetical protein